MGGSRGTELSKIDKELQEDCSNNYSVISLEHISVTCRHPELECHEAKAVKGFEVQPRDVNQKAR